jgi:hypothetical protein
MEALLNPYHVRPIETALIHLLKPRFNQTATPGYLAKVFRVAQEEGRLAERLSEVSA